MKKYTIIGVIILMSISLLGVVGLQLYWITDAIRVKEAQFDKDVHNALKNAVDKLETQEAVAVVTQNMNALHHTTDTIVSDPKPVEKPQPKPEKKPAPAKPVPLKQNKTITPENQPHTPPAASEIIWLKDATVLHSNIVPGKKGQRWMKLANGDTILMDERQFTRNGAVHYTEVLPALKRPADVRLKMQGHPDRKAAVRILENVNADNIRRSADSAAVLFKNYSQTFNFPLDTLRMVASKMDSMHQFARFYSSIKPSDMASLQIRNDSIFVNRKGARKPEFLQLNRQSPQSITIYNHASGLQKELLKGNLPEEIASRNKSVAGTTTMQQPKEAAGGQKKSAHTTSETEKPTQIKAAPAPEKKSATEKLEQKKEKLNDVVQKMVVEYVAKDEPLQTRLNLHGLPDLLRDELHKQGIDLPFGYYVVSAEKDTLASKTIAAYAEDTRYYPAALFPNDLIEKPDYLSVYFPDTKFYAMSSLAGMMALSGLFTLIIIATFGTTIHIIYKQKKLSEMKNDFINNMTHEFKTPIATISLATDSIANPKVYSQPDKIQYYTNIIRQENKRMNTQVENVLQIALLEKNEFKMKLEPVDMHMLIVKAIESIQLQVEQRLGQINVQLDALKYELQSDEIHLYNVICNLLDNANKYSPASPEINLSTRNADGGIVITIDDKGMGMSKDTQQRVFEKFYRVPTGNLHNVKGFGLGLSYVKAIVQAHHGNIKLWSEPGKGSRFEIFLPFSSS